MSSSGRTRLLRLGVLALVACDVQEPLLRMVELTAIASGDAHSCALSTSGAAYCWGDGRAGQLGAGDRHSSRFPRRVSGDGQFSVIDAGGRHSCGIAADGVAYCWGANDSGQLGSGDLETATTPRRVETGERFGAISTGWSHTCAVSVAGRVLCWGSGANGEVGSAGFGPIVRVPTPVRSTATFKQVSAGGRHSCAIAVGGAAYCWGANELGQLGIGSAGEPVGAPARVVGNIPFDDISAGWNHSCGTSAGGVGYCWGENAYGETGGGWVAAPGRPGEVAPTKVVSYGEIAFVQLSAGRSFSCGRRDQGAAYCWGLGDHGQLGMGRLLNNFNPQWVIPGPDRTAVAAMDVFVRVDAGGTHACATSISGTAFCWGNGAQGQLGSGARLSMVALPVMETP